MATIDFAILERLMERMSPRQYTDIHLMVADYLRENEPARLKEYINDLLWQDERYYILRDYAYYDRLLNGYIKEEK
jgi:hypothetical protein